MNNRISINTPFKNLNIIPHKRLLFLILFFTVGMLWENSFAVFFASLLWLIFGFLIIYISFPKKARKTTIRLWLLFYTLYYGFALISNILYVDNPYKDFFFHYDSIEFYTRIDYILEQSKSINMYDKVLYEGRHWPGFAVISWGLGLLANFFGDTNNITLQKTQIVFYCALTIVFLYNTARIFFTQEKAFKISVLFGLLSHILVFSAAYSRDTPILMLYSIGFYIIMGSWSFRNLFLLVLLGLLTMQFRFQHGISFILLIAVYVFLRTKKIKNKLLYFILIFFLLVSGGLFVTLTISSYQKETIEKIENYQDYHGERFEDAGGITSVMSKLPAMLKPLGNAIIGQTYPYPPTRVLYVKAVDGNQWLKLPLIFSQIFWMFVWFVIFYGYSKKKYRKQLPEKLMYGLFAGVILILAVSFGSYENRRMLCAYPIIFLASFNFFHKMPYKKRYRLLYIFFYIYFILLTFYLFLKA